MPRPWLREAGSFPAADAQRVSSRHRYAARQPAGPDYIPGRCTVYPWLNNIFFMATDSRKHKHLYVFCIHNWSWCAVTHCSLLLVFSLIIKPFTYKSRQIYYTACCMQYTEYAKNYYQTHWWWGKHSINKPRKLLFFSNRIMTFFSRLWKVVLYSGCFLIIHRKFGLVYYIDGQSKHDELDVFSLLLKKNKVSK